METKKLNLGAIRIDGGTQAREQLDQSTVAEYSQHMLDGEVFPPVVVFFDGSEYWLADGFHRYFATKANGNVSIEAQITKGTQQDAQLFSYGANGGRGLSLKPVDVQNIIKAMLVHPTSKTWTNAQVARHVGVSKMTVGRVKAKLQEVEQPEEEEEIKTYVRKDGASVKVNTKNLGKKEKPAAPDVPEESEDDHILSELGSTINELKQENDILKGQIAIGQWDASEIEKIDAQEIMDELRERIRVLEIDNHALRDSRDTFQARNAELLKMVKSLQAKLKKYES